jgi:hypothetical protein
MVKCLIFLPSTDVNYQSALKRATSEEIKEAIDIMLNSDGKHKAQEGIKMSKIYEITGTSVAIAVSEETGVHVVYDLENERSIYDLFGDAEEITAQELPEEAAEVAADELPELKPGEIIKAYDTQAQDGERITWYTAESWEA